MTAPDNAAAELGPDTGSILVTRGSVSNAYDRDVTLTITGTAGHLTDYNLGGPGLLGAGIGSATVRIPAGQASTTLTLTPIFGGEVEGSETAIFTAEGTSATVTIADEPAVTVTAPDNAAAELGPDTGSILVTRGSVSNVYDRDVTLTITGTAGHLTDYNLSGPDLLGAGIGSATVRIPAGQASTTLTLTPIFGGEVEGSETAIFTAEGTSATVTIADEPAVTVTAPDNAAAELGPDTGSILVTRGSVSNAYDRDVTLDDHRHRRASHRLQPERPRPARPASASSPSGSRPVRPPPLSPSRPSSAARSRAPRPPSSLPRAPAPPSPSPTSPPLP